MNWYGERVLILSLYDISQKVYASRLKELDLFKNRLMLSVSHDLKTPLNAILMYSQSEEIQHRGTPGQPIAQRIMQNSHLLLNMINNLID